MAAGAAPAAVGHEPIDERPAAGWRDGRHAGVVAHGAQRLTLERLVVHGHGTHGIDLAGGRDSTVEGCEVYDVGCSGIRAAGGEAAPLAAGGLRVSANRVRRHAQWKRSYQPGVFWAGVGNVYSSHEARPPRLTRAQHLCSRPASCLL